MYQRKSYTLSKQWQRLEVHGKDLKCNHGGLKDQSNPKRFQGKQIASKPTLKTQQSTIFHPQQKEQLQKTFWLSEKDILSSKDRKTVSKLT